MIQYNTARLRDARSCRITALGAALMLGLSGNAAWAHHSFAMFDYNRCLAVSGTVRNFEWTFPHVWLWIVAGNGADDIWGFEAASPGDLSRRMHEGEVKNPAQWSHDVMHVGDKVTVQYNPLKSGKHGGAVASVTLPNGRVLPGGTPGGEHCPDPIGTTTK